MTAMVLYNNCFDHQYLQSYITDPLTKTITAIRCLAHFLTTKEKKKGKDKDEGSEVDTPYILKECPVS